MDIEQLYRDELTGVYNRRYLKDKLENQIQSYIADKKCFSVVMVDIDHFKDINDTYGHMRGDKIIIDFAKFLTESLRSTDIVIRFGGDEFTCIMPDTTKANAESIHRRITATCREKKLGNLTVTLSAGIAAFPEDGNTFDELLKNADIALYDAKRGGRNRVGVVGEKRVEIPIKVFINRLKEKENIKRNLIEHGNQIRVTIVRGIVGVGKTRLSKEVLGDIKGKEVIWSDCVYFEEPLAYYAVRELIKYRIKRRGIEIFKDMPFAYKLEIGKLIPELLEGAKDQVEAVSMVMDRYRLYESVRQMIEIGEREKVLIIDNVQWIDNESTEVLKYLVRAFRESPIAFILIQRTEERSEMVEAFLSFISREFEVQEIVLEPFEHQEIIEAIKAVIGIDPPADLVKYVVHESGGIPFYIEEIMRTLIENRSLQIQHGNWVFTPPEQELLPRNLTDIALKKYRALTKEAQYILEIASTLGWFDLELLKQITEFNEGHIMGLMNEISRMGITKYAQDKYVFSAAISRNAIYDKFVKGFKAKTLHRSIAATIEENNKGREEDMAEDLAIHYYTAQDKDKGVKYCLLAGDKARNKYANQDAIRYYTWASRLLHGSTDKQSSTKHIECQLKLATMMLFTGSTSEAMAIINDAQKLGEMGDDDKINADILVQKTSIYLQTAQYDLVIETGLQTAKIFDRIGLKKEKALLFCMIGRAHSRTGKYDQAMEFFTEALKIFDEIKADDEKTSALINIGNVNHDQGNYNAALENYQKCLEIHRKLGDLDGEGRVLTNMSNAYSKLGKIDDALGFVKRASSIFNKIGDRINEARALNNTATILDTLGQFEEGLKLYKQALKIHQDIGNRDGEALVLLNIASIEWHFNEREKAKSLLDKALKIAEDIKGDTARLYCMLNMVDICLWSDEYKKVDSLLEKILSIAEKSKPHLEYALQAACECYLKRKQFDRLDLALARLAELVKELDIPRAYAVQSQLLGRYYYETGQYNKAADCLNEALKLFETIKERQMVATTYYYLSKVEKAMGNLEKGADLLAKASMKFSAMKARRWMNTIAQDSQKQS